MNELFPNAGLSAAHRVLIGKMLSIIRNGKNQALNATEIISSVEQEIANAGLE